jgi:hypothetical protein
MKCSAFASAVFLLSLGCTFVVGTTMRSTTTSNPAAKSGLPRDETKLLSTPPDYQLRGRATETRAHRYRHVVKHGFRALLYPSDAIRKLSEIGERNAHTGERIVRRADSDAAVYRMADREK